MRSRRSETATPRREGFALPAVLWLLVTISAVSLMGTLAARDAVATAQNRVSHRRALWRAEGCAELVRATLAASLRDADRSWAMLDTVVASSADLTASGCTIETRASGTTLDVNSASADQLRALFRATGKSESGADSLADAILDWRDDDDDPRPAGAEAAWYRAAGQALPRNSAFADVAELGRVRGMMGVGGVDTLLGVDEGRILLGRAPHAVLAALPGFGAEAVERLLELRARGESPRDLLSFSAVLSPDARAAMLARYAELAAMAGIQPEAWVVTMRASEGANGVTSEVELRLVRAGARAAVVRRRDR